MKLLILLIAVILISTFKIYADEAYKYSFEPLDYYEGGMIIPDSGSSGISMYFIKPSAIDTTDFIYKWDGFKRNKATGFSYGSGRIISAAITSENICTVVQKPRELVFRIFNQNFEPINYFLLDSTLRLGESPDCTIKISNGKALVLCYNTLYKIDFLKQNSATKIADNVLYCNFSKLHNTKTDVIEYFYVEKNLSSSIIKFANSQNETEYSTQLEPAEQMNFINYGDFLGIFSSAHETNNSLVRIIDMNNGIIRASGWIKAPPAMIDFAVNGEQIQLYSVNFNDNSYYFHQYNLVGNSFIESGIGELPDILTEPLLLKNFDGKCIIVFRNGFASIDNSYYIEAYDRYPVGEKFDSIEHIYILDNHLIISSTNASAIFDIELHPYWFITRFLQNPLKYLVLVTLVGLLILFIQLYRHQRRLFKEVLELQTIGIIFILDSSGRLKIANRNGMDFLEINESVPLGKLFAWYAQTQGAVSISHIVENTSQTGENFTGPITITVDGSDKEYFVRTIILRNIAGINRGIVFTAIDITEQIERKRLSNWAQLAHDMQTNLSTIRLNAEQMDTETSDNNRSRRKKIVHQVNLLMQRVRDLVTVGRNDSVNLIPVSSSEICIETRNEFDESIFPNVSFNLNLIDFEFLADKPKLIRALRNAIENGIKALPNARGEITVSAYKNGKQAVFKIKDSGAGMDEETKKKMLTPYFTTAREKGGSGIGTMIMQHVIEMHGGEIFVESQKGIGTEITFLLPLNMKHPGI